MVAIYHPYFFYTPIDNSYFYRPKLLNQINMKKFKNLFIYTAICSGIALYSCEGPMGPAGKDGEAGKDANETCKLCHNPSVVDAISSDFSVSKHSWGEASLGEAGNTSCAPCHESDGFKDVCANNTSVAFVADPANAGKYLNPYASSAGKSIGEITCNTCHDSLHVTYGMADFAHFTTTAAVPMTMWGGAETIDLTQDGGKSNLCVKCHQPRPFTNSNTDKNLLNYAGLASAPTAVFYDAAQSNSLNVMKPGYRTHTHYGTVGAIFAGKGGVEFTGSVSYSNSSHTTLASCQDCHMAEKTGKAGGHTFYAKGNFNGCNVSGCHSSMSATNTSFTADRTDIKNLLNLLAAKLKVGGVEILNRNPDASSNLWAGLTTNNYDGYLNIYDPINNPDGLTNNPGGTFKNPGSTTGWTSAQVTTNNGLPLITLTNAQMGAIINFQLCLREYSLGIHNYGYTKALLANSLAILP